MRNFQPALEKTRLERPSPFFFGLRLGAGMEPDPESDAFGNTKPIFKVHPAMKKMCLRDIQKQKDLRRRKFTFVTSPEEAAWYAKQAAHVAANNVKAAQISKDPAVVERALASAALAIEAVASAASAATKYK